MKQVFRPFAARLAKQGILFRQNALVYRPVYSPMRGRVITLIRRGHKEARTIVAGASGCAPPRQPRGAAGRVILSPSWCLRSRGFQLPFCRSHRHHDHCTAALLPRRADGPSHRWHARDRAGYGCRIGRSGGRYSACPGEKGLNQHTSMVGLRNANASCSEMPPTPRPRLK